MPVSLQLQGGEILRIQGPNGSGKTTLTRIMAGLLEPASGEIRINGLTRNPSEIRGVFSVFNVSDMQYAFTAPENIYFSEDIRLTTEQESILPFPKDRTLGKTFDDSIDLSSGQWQLIKLLRVLSKDSAVYIFDEPFSQLDPGRKEWLASQLVQLKRNGKAVIVVSHEPVDIEFDAELTLEPTGREVAYA
nr:ATP-binding cassette domain-containing protein [Deinobacterium chartae]